VALRALVLALAGSVDSAGVVSSAGVAIVTGGDDPLAVFAARILYASGIARLSGLNSSVSANALSSGTVSASTEFVFIGLESIVEQAAVQSITNTATSAVIESLVGSANRGSERADGAEAVGILGPVSDAVRASTGVLVEGLTVRASLGASTSAVVEVGRESGTADARALTIALSRVEDLRSRASSLANTVADVVSDIVRVGARGGGAVALADVRGQVLYGSDPAVSGVASARAVARVQNFVRSASGALAGAVRFNGSSIEAFVGSRADAAAVGRRDLSGWAGDGSAIADAVSSVVDVDRGVSGTSLRASGGDSSEEISGRGESFVRDEVVQRSRARAVVLLESLKSNGVRDVSDLKALLEISGVSEGDLVGARVSSGIDTGSAVGGLVDVHKEVIGIASDVGVARLVLDLEDDVESDSRSGVLNRPVEMGQLA